MVYADHNDKQATLRRFFSSRLYTVLRKIIQLYGKQRVHRPKEGVKVGCMAGHGSANWGYASQVEQAQASARRAAR